MQKLLLLSGIALLSLASISLSPKPVMAGCGWGDITCNPKKWTCPPGGCGREEQGATPTVQPPSSPFKSLPPGTDLGHSRLPRSFVDVNGDGLADYCRFVGDAPNIFIACMLRTSGSRWGGQLDYQSIKGIDQGHSSQPRGFKDINGDRKADYCRFVGDAPNIIESCNLAESNGFSTDQFHNF